MSFLLEQTVNYNKYIKITYNFKLDWYLLNNICKVFAYRNGGMYTKLLVGMDLKKNEVSCLKISYSYFFCECVALPTSYTEWKQTVFWSLIVDELKIIILEFEQIWALDTGEK